MIEGDSMSRKHRKHWTLNQPATKPSSGLLVFRISYWALHVLQEALRFSTHQINLGIRSLQKLSIDDHSDAGVLHDWMRNIRIALLQQSTVLSVVPELLSYRSTLLGYTSTRGVQNSDAQ